MAEAKNRVNIVILDACRNNPVRAPAARGLAGSRRRRRRPRHLVAYATAPGSVAADGDGTNGLYTEDLLQALRVPGLKVEEVFKRVRIAVAERSKGSQTPWESSSLTGDLVVNVTVNVTNVAAATPPPTAPDRESLFWMSIKDGDDPAAFQAYLKQYPERTFAALARQRLASVSKAPRALTPTRFDGTWDVTVDCPAHQAAAGYKWRFQAEVKDGLLSGQYGVAGNPSSMAGQRIEARPCTLTFVK